MSTNPMFSRRHEITDPVTLTVDDLSVTAQAGDTVAAAMLAAALDGPFRRSVVGGQPRAPYCLIGACFECLVEIDGMPNRQACLIVARDGMTVRRQMGLMPVETSAVETSDTGAGEGSS